MKNIITFDAEEFKNLLYDVVESSYILGIAYVENTPSFSKEEAIKRLQEKLWGTLSNTLSIVEVDE